MPHVVSIPVSSPRKGSNVTELEKRVQAIAERQSSRGHIQRVLPGEDPLARDWRVIGRDGWAAIRRFEAENPAAAERVRREMEKLQPA